MHTFSPATQAWFQGAFASATAAQTGAWKAIAAGQHTLVVAPTGSGKTLAAFLHAIDRLAHEQVPSDPLRRCRVLYVSPLKALAVDVERNLRSPLTGIRQAAVRLGLAEPTLSVATRSGDTTAQERRQFAREPADILITTPESLFLMLTSAARDALRGVDTVIVDEIHAVCASKRGAHLAVSLERLDALLERPAQRIGLSATVRPIEEVSTFLAGGRPVSVVAPPTTKTFELKVVVPVADMGELGEPTQDLSGAAAGSAHRASIWPHVEERVLDLIEQHRSTIVFANSRRLAERLTARLNELATERAGLALLAEHRAPAQVMAASGSGHPITEVVVARAHHGSVSREQRAIVEEALKAGNLPAVVATASLELGIDMGAVDLVVQVESPPSVASGLQRVGRAGHQVGAVSQGVIFPKYRGDLVECAVVAERMANGEIEQLRFPRNPLDVLAQQIVAMLAVDEWSVDALEELVRRSAPFAGMPRSVLLAVLDMLAGRYPSDAFAELRPRIVWDRDSDTLHARAGAQRLAVTSGGTIPDRGMFGVFLVGDGDGRRVGELDEEMVYESRVGDVFLLGSSSWRIEEITPDRVLVTPAPGQIGRMPFWKGDSLGRPAELGRALGQFQRELSAATPEQARARAEAAGVDTWGVDNLLAYLHDQRQATGQVPDDRTVVVERFRDELGDWRLVVHSPFGAPVNAPWALAIGARVRERLGIQVQSMHSDDGIVLRLPDTDAEPPDADLVVFDPEEIESIVTSEVGGSALFASRFRECAARSLLLPRRDPKRRTPLWQQRQRANQLLQVASEYSDFPVVLEAMRECLQDVYDLPGLCSIMRELRSRRLRLVDVVTPTASPFAQSLLFGYVGMFLYDSDAPLAERQAQALSLDSSLLAELLGTTDLRELLDPHAIDETQAQLQRLHLSYPISGIDAVHDLLRHVGDLSTAEALLRGATAAELTELESRKRALQVRIGGEQRWVAIEDAGRLRDALGCALPIGVPEAFTEPVRDPVADLVSRYARTHGPFLAEEIAHRLGLGVAVVLNTLQRLRANSAVVEGEFRPAGSAQTSTGREWCDAAVLRTIRRKSLAALRKEIEPVSTQALAQFTSEWHGISSRSARGSDALLRSVEQLAGCSIVASSLETLVLPARVADYTPQLLDQLTAAGQVLWAGTGALAGNDGWITLVPAADAPLLLPAHAEDAGDDLSPLQQDIMALLSPGHAMFATAMLQQLSAEIPVTVADVRSAIWDLVWRGLITNDTIAVLRARLAGSTKSTRTSRTAQPRLRYGRYSTLAYGLRGNSGASTGNHLTGSQSLPADLAGRWSALPERDMDVNRRAVTTAHALLDRHGLLTRGAVNAEHVIGGFSAVYPVLRAAEESGQVRRGYFVEGLGASQFAMPGAVDRLRLMSKDRDPVTDSVTTRQRAGGPSTTTVVLAATDPANPYGAALPWPERQSSRTDNAQSVAPTANAETPEHSPQRRQRGHQPARKAGAVVVLVDGCCALYVERGGKTLLSFSDDHLILQPAADALALAVRDGALGRLQVERADGQPALATELGAALETAGFRPTPRGGLRLRA